MKFGLFLIIISLSNSYANSFSKEDIKYCKEVAMTQKKVECAEARINTCQIIPYHNERISDRLICNVKGNGGGELRDEIFKSVVTEYGPRKTSCKLSQKKSKKEAMELCKNKYKSCYVITSGVSKFPEGNTCETTTIVAGKNERKR